MTLAFAALLVAPNEIDSWATQVAFACVDSAAKKIAKLTYFIIFGPPVALWTQRSPATIQLLPGVKLNLGDP